MFSHPVIFILPLFVPLLQVYICFAASLVEVRFLAAATHSSYGCGSNQSHLADGGVAHVSCSTMATGCKRVIVPIQFRLSLSDSRELKIILSQKLETDDLDQPKPASGGKGGLSAGYSIVSDLSAVARDTTR